MGPEERASVIEQRLRANLTVEQFALEDQSQAHAGHASAGGAGHFAVYIVSPDFEGQRLLQRHRMVYAALAGLMQSEIHALTINARTPLESATD